MTIANEINEFGESPRVTYEELNSFIDTRTLSLWEEVEAALRVVFCAKYHWNIDNICHIHFVPERPPQHAFRVTQLVMKC